jgi:hypothetical protein
MDKNLKIISAWAGVLIAVIGVYFAMQAAIKISA